jgi:hypothetical protein
MKYSYAVQASHCAETDGKVDPEIRCWVSKSEIEYLFK